MATMLTIYSGRLALATIEIRWLGGRATYRAQLANGQDLGTFTSQKAGREAIDARLPDLTERVWLSG